eukprot:scaffold503_cov375-Pinguiococcus_pyrenoidosus.AAC.19
MPQSARHRRRLAASRDPQPTPPAVPDAVASHSCAESRPFCLTTGDCATCSPPRPFAAPARRPSAFASPLELPGAAQTEAGARRPGRPSFGA